MLTIFRDVVVDDEPELEDQVSEDEDAGKEEAERIAKEEAEKALVSEESLEGIAIHFTSRVWVN